MKDSFHFYSFYYQIFFIWTEFFSAFGSGNNSCTTVSANSLNKSETRSKNNKKIPVSNFKNRPVNKSNEKKKRKTKVRFINVVYILYIKILL